MAIINNINLTRDDFRIFRESGYFYVDKSVFIEHVIEDSNDIILLPRPRRMGKTMNLTMLRSFFDMNEDSANLFHGLYIESRPTFARHNSSPVLYLDFKTLQPETYKKDLAEAILLLASKYLTPEEINPVLSADLSSKEAMIENAVSLPRKLMQNIEAATGKRTVVLLDEYDKLFMDSIDKPYFQQVREFIKAVMLSMFKGNPHLERAVITGVNRIAQESMFSDLNNPSIYDVFSKNRFETDFGLTEEEVAAIVPPEYLDEARLRYNNYRVGNSKVYFTYSLLSFLSIGEFENYWGMSGAMALARRGLNSERFDIITQLISGFPQRKIQIKLKRKLSVEDMNFNDDAAYYSMLVQTGYLAFDFTSTRDEYNVYLPNMELCEVWQDFILAYFKEQDFSDSRLRELFRSSVPTTERFSKEFNYFVDNRLSYFDLDPIEPERTYHAFILGLITAFGYKGISNRESGNGRFDVIALLPQYNVIFEFKQIPAPPVGATVPGRPSPAPPVGADIIRPLESAAEAAITQIREKRYFADYIGDKPMLLAGIGFCGKQCYVNTEVL